MYDLSSALFVSPLPPPPFPLLHSRPNTHFPLGPVVCSRFKLVTGHRTVMQDVRIVVDSYGRGLRGPPPSAEMNPIVYTDTLTITIVGVKRKISQEDANPIYHYATSNIDVIAIL